MSHQFFEVLIQQNPHVAISSLCTAFEKEGRNDLIVILKEGAENEGIEISLPLLENTSQEETGGLYHEETGGPYEEEEQAPSKHNRYG
jgi:hypothetical protein